MNICNASDPDYAAAAVGNAERQDLLKKVALATYVHIELKRKSH